MNTYMISEQVLTYIGMSVVILGAVYYVYKVMQVQDRVIEGLVSNSKKSLSDIMANNDIQALKGLNEKMADTLLIGKYRTNYEDMILDLETALDNTILMSLINISGNVNKNDSSLDISNEKTGLSKAIPMLNDLYKLKKNLNLSMDFLDSQKSSSGSLSIF